MTPAQRLQAVSDALFGHWSPSMLGKKLGVSERTVRRWGEGKFAVPAGVWADCAVLCEIRAQKLHAMARNP